ncbi:MAG TPA: hypothetical protein VI854_09645, partial [Acidimicrobiia bacterium]|nr:hypothetical protein [Acidimicrobiia bacterium]
NLIGMGILPLQFRPGESVEALGLSGHEELDIGGVAPAIGRGELPGEVEVQAGRRSFRVRVRIDTLTEALYYRHGGILQYVLRRLRG